MKKIIKNTLLSAIALGGLAACGNHSVNDLDDLAEASCVLPESGPHTDLSTPISPKILEAVTIACIKNLKNVSLDATKTGPSSAVANSNSEKINIDANNNYNALKLLFENEAGALMSSEINERVLYYSAMDKFKTALQKLTFEEGIQRLYNTTIEIDIQSLVPIIQNGSETGNYSGKWKIRISDASVHEDISQARYFGYDHLTTEASQPSGSSEGHTNFRFVARSAIGRIVGEGSSDSSMSHQANRSCDEGNNDREAACLITKEMHRVINEDLSDAEIANFLALQAKAPSSNMNNRRGIQRDHWSTLERQVVEFSPRIVFEYDRRKRDYCYHKTPGCYRARIAP